MRNVKQIVCYAKKYGQVLTTGDARDIATMDGDKRRHVMAAMAAYSKANGCYPAWKGIVEKYQLKWSAGNSDAFYAEYIEQMLSGEQQLPEMLTWLNDTCHKLPPVYANALLFNTLTGLRPSEACEALKLLKSDRSNYVLEKSGLFILQHYRYPQFQRRTKKAFLSILTPEIMQLADRCEPVSWEAMRSAINKRGMPTHLKWCRKIHGTVLRQAGLDPEVIDVLAGRVPRSVFRLYYLRGGLDLPKIGAAVDSLHRQVVAPCIKE